MSHDPREAEAEAQRLREGIAAIHRSLLPRPVRGERLLLDLRYLPMGQLGGDYCQLQFAAPEVCYLSMSDVVGHDARATLVATRVSSEVRHWMLEGRAPREIVERLNEFVLEYFAELGMLLSLFVARLDLAAGRLSWSGAGHPSPFLIRRQGGEPAVLDSQNVLIGVQEACLGEEPEHALALAPGDRLFFYTDGLSETRDATGEPLGLEGLAAIAAGVRHLDLFEVADQVIAAVEAYQAGEATDDRTLVVAEIRGGAAGG